MDAIVDMLDDIIIVFIVGLYFKMKRDVIEWIIYVCIFYMILVSIEAVITALIPYSFKMSGFWAPKTLPR